MPTNLEGWRAAANRRLPRVAFDFIEGGADDEVTLQRNRTAFDDLTLIPRMLRGVEHASAELDLFGQHLRLPVLPAPTGDSRIAGPPGDFAQAKGASAAGTVSILSGVASTAPDQVAAAVPGPQWLQTFLYRDREATQRFVGEAKQLGFAALVLTADGPVKGNRERDTRNGLRLPLKPTPRMALGAARRPRWMWEYFTNNDPRKRLPVDGGLAARTRTLLAHTRQPPLSVPATFNIDQKWEDLHWLRSVWDGPLLLKGVMCGEDAELALEAGCEGVVVSNHGGRQLDAAPASIEMLPEVVAAVGGRMEILIDSGIRRGTDVVKALSLGATACLVGRPWLYALAVAGEHGVKEMLEQLHAEILRAMQLVGANNLDQLDPGNLRRRPGSGWERISRPHSAVTS